MFSVFQSDDGRTNRWVTSFFCLVAIVLGAYQAWDTRYAMNADGISYLDMGDAYLRGDWDMAINAYWSPFYSLLLGIAIYIFRPSAYWEYPLVHFVNLLIYLFTLGCFHFFLKQWLQDYKYRLTSPPGNQYTACPEWAMTAFAYSLFIWSSLTLITISIVTPDMCVAAFVFLASGLVLRIHTGDTRRLIFVMLGMVLGLSYLAKAVMFPVSFVFLLMSFFLADGVRKAAPLVLISLTTFLIVASPFIAALSLSKDRLTYGDSGKLNYAWYVNSVPVWTHWQGGSAGSGSPIHPPRQILDKPAVYEFGTPRGGTYPLWYDPSYWYEGVQVHFDLSKQLRIIRNHIKDYAGLFMSQPVLLIGCFILCFLSRRRWLCIKDMAGQWNLLLPAVAVMGLYAMVHVEKRFLGALMVLLWTGIFSGIKPQNSKQSKTLLSGMAVFMAMVVMTGAAYSPLKGIYHLLRSDKIQPAAAVPVQVAEALNQIGIGRGDRIAVIGWTDNISWARLAGVKIVADIPSEGKNTFLEADSTIKARVYKTFQQTGAKIIVINMDPDYYDPLDKWKRIGNSDYYIYNLEYIATELHG